MMEDSWEAADGSPDPLGASWIPSHNAFNFALYSKHATRVELCCYSPEEVRTPVFAFEFDRYRNRTGRIWHCRVHNDQLNGAVYYGYRVDGPPPGAGFGWHNFDAEKILLDPYARAVFFPDGYDRDAARLPGPNDGQAPLGRLCRGGDGYDWSGDQAVRHAHDLVIYELHVRGFTQNPNSGVDKTRRGTFAGVVDKIPYLKELGVTAVELLPVHQFDPQEGNYWGYMTLNFFAPHHAYSINPQSCIQRDEFRDLVKKLHAANIEVILDVVYNHTSEGNHQGPNYSFKGIDSSTYYMINYGNHADPFANHALCGNTMHAANGAVRRLILDSMRYWVEEMHVDGFRFDLASILARNTDGSFNFEAPLFTEIASDPVLNRVRLIAEQWGIRERFKFPGRVWRQWNGEYRDCLRCFVKSDPGFTPQLMTRLYGSDDLFPDELPHSMRPYQSINYIASHDGLSLADLVSYSQRTDRTDGQYPQHGWDCGHRGVDGVPDQVVGLRKRQVKNFTTLLMLSNGTPMFRMGDEFMQTQRGHADPYNVDSDLTWLNWDLLGPNRDVFRFYQKMIAFRKTHPFVSQPVYWRDRVSWYGVAGLPDYSSENRALAFCLTSPDTGEPLLYAMINAYWQPLDFRIQEFPASGWRRFVNTYLASPNDFVDGGEAIAGDRYLVGERSVVVLAKY